MLPVVGKKLILPKVAVSEYVDTAAYLAHTDYSIRNILGIFHTNRS